MKVVREFAIRHREKGQVIVYPGPGYFASIGQPPWVARRYGAVREHMTRGLRRRLAGSVN